MTKTTFTLRTMSLVVIAAIAIGCGEEGTSVETVTSALSGLQNFAFNQGGGGVWLDEGGSLVSTGLQAAPASASHPSFAMVGSTMYVAYHGQNNNWGHNHFWFDQIGMNPYDSGKEMYEATSPSLSVFGNGTVAWAFQNSAGHLWIALNGAGSGQDTHGVMWPYTSPVITWLPNGRLAIAFEGINRHLWLGLDGPFSGLDTGGVIWTSHDSNPTYFQGTIPSIAALPNATVAYAFHGYNGDLWFGEGNGFGGFDTGMQMHDFFSPSVTIDRTTGRPQVLFVFPSGHIGNWSCDSIGNCSGLDLGGSPCTGCDPTWVYSDNGSWEFFYCGSNGHLWIGSNVGNADQGVSCMF